MYSVSRFGNYVGFGQDGAAFAAMLAEHGGYLPGPQPAACGGPAELMERMQEEALLYQRAAGEHQELNAALQPEPWDNATSSDVKGGYREAQGSVQTSRDQAEALARRYGPGRHRTPWGEVEVFTDSRTGETRVNSRNTAGRSRVVDYGLDPDQTQVMRHEPDGQYIYEGQNGTTLTQATWGGPEAPPELLQYSLGPDEQPVQNTYGPGPLWTESTANPDGSSTTAGPYGESWQPPLPWRSFGGSPPPRHSGPFDYISIAQA